MKKFKVMVNVMVTDVFYIEANSEDGASSLANSGKIEPSYSTGPHYESEDIFEAEEDDLVSKTFYKAK